MSVKLINKYESLDPSEGIISKYSVELLDGRVVEFGHDWNDAWVEYNDEVIYDFMIDSGTYDVNREHVIDLFNEASKLVSEFNLNK